MRVAPPQPGRCSPQAPTCIPGPDPRKVLVVDDECDLADMAAALLGGHGLAARVAYSARQALEILQSDRDIDAVFSDVMMPQTTGLQLARTVGDLYPHVKIVLASGYTYPALLSECGQTYPYLAKPYRIDAVIKLLRGQRQ